QAARLRHRATVKHARARQAIPAGWICSHSMPTKGPGLWQNSVPLPDGSPGGSVASVRMAYRRTWPDRQESLWRGRVPASPVVSGRWLAGRRSVRALREGRAARQVVRFAFQDCSVNGKRWLLRCLMNFGLGRAMRALRAPGAAEGRSGERGVGDWIDDRLESWVENRDSFDAKEREY